MTRSCIILQDFDDEAIKKSEVQTQILFGRKMSKLGSKSGTAPVWSYLFWLISITEPPHPPLCVITNQPARYRDPKTGLPYHNAYAFKKIQKLAKGEFKWSKVLGTWVGDGSDAAKGVPDRFLRPEMEEERKERLERKEREKKLAEEEKKAAEAAKAPQSQEEPPAHALGPAAVTEAAPATSLAATPGPVHPTATAPTFASPDVPPLVPAGVSAIMPSPDDSKPLIGSPAAPTTPMSGLGPAPADGGNAGTGPGAEEEAAQPAPERTQI